MENKVNRTDQLVTFFTKCSAIILLAGLILWGGKYVWGSYHYEETNDAQIEEYVNPVSTRVNGYIKKVNFEENQQVSKGDTLVIIDNNEYQIQQQEAEASLANAAAEINVLESSIVVLQNTAKVTQSQISAAKAKLIRQEQEYSRYQKLLTGESATQQQFDNIKAAFEIAKSEYQTTLSNYQASLSKVKEAQSRKASIEAEIKKRDAMLGLKRLNLNYTVILAPYRGRVGKKNIQVGQLVQAGQVLTFIVNQDAGKWVIANFKETQTGKFKRNQPALITVDAYPGYTFHGVIESQSPATGSRFSLLPPDNATGNFVKTIQRIPVRIRLTDIPEKTAGLKAGMNANVSINH
ncbi:HlyD family secretion protein [Pedobacter sp. UYP1]|uniref:HlyD family secretion protein n=1 Tax=Pedobacter sp. UYP1 TaxID=1756396 RepID=UPI0033986EB3